MSTELVVFIHGLGANNLSWWGTSVHSIYNHPSFWGRSRVQFYGYPTRRFVAGRPWHFFGGHRVPGLAQATTTLASTLTPELQSGEIDAVTFVGHSQGGVLALGATVHLASDFHSAARAPVLIASPIAGSRLARFASTMPGNRQHRDLSTGSAFRADVVDRYWDATRTSPNLLPYIIGAQSDATVHNKERWFCPSDVDLPQNHVASIPGGHSTCVQNLDRGSIGLSVLTEKIRNSLDTPSMSGAAKPLDIRHYFDIPLYSNDRTG